MPRDCMLRRRRHHGTFFLMKEALAFLAVELLLSRCLHSCNSFPRWLSKSGGSLRLFFQSVVNEPYESFSCTSRLTEAENFNRDVWPIPIPFPEVFRCGGFGKELWKKRVVAMEVLILNWLHLGMPSAAPTSLKVGSRLSRRQWEVVRYLLHVSFDGNTPELVDVGLMGRAAMKFEKYRACSSLHL